MKYVGSIPFNNQGVYQSTPQIGLGYYNGYYGYNQNPYYYQQTYDPFEIRRRQEEEYQKQLKIRRGQIESMKKMIEINCHFFGYEFDESAYDEMYSDEKIYERQRDMQQHINMHQLQQCIAQQNIQQQMKYQEIENNGYPTEVKDETLLEFLEGTARDEYIKIVEDGYYKQSKQAIGSLYNKPGYEELLRIHNANRFLSPNVTIDDMEITLPEHLRNTRNERREKFLQCITQGIPIGGDV